VLLAKQDRLPLWLLVLVLLGAGCSSSEEVTTTRPPAAAEFRRDVPAAGSTASTVATTTSESPPAPATTPPSTAPSTLPGQPDLREPPYFETGQCVSEASRQLASDPARVIECGQLVVLEDRARPEGALVRLPVMIARTQNPDPAPDPVIYLAGGGGHNHLRYVNYLMDGAGDAVLERRDFIQYNQRGAPLTSPELSCPGLIEFLFDLAAQPLSQQEWSDSHIAFLSDCRDNLVAAGVDLTKYNTAINAADADDLRRALGYDQANFYGTSYGTRLGLDLIRDYPDGVRSVILDSVYPPQAGFYAESGANLQDALEYLFAACAVDSGCSTAYPDLGTLFYETVARLDETPEWAESPGGRVLVDGGVFMDAVSLYLYSPDSIPYAPHAIARAANGDFGPLAGPIAGAITSSDISWVMWYAMQCREEIPFESFDTASEIGASLDPGVASHYIDGWARFHFTLCEEWGLPAADPIESLPVTSDVPALVLAGGFDPVTPPAWGGSTAAALDRSFYYEFPNVGHGVMRSTDCGLSIGLQFLDDPLSEPDAACIATMPPPDFEG
jgi:pimeloyl-ACP methyl ester carboxylesterase